jgi:tRNA 2-thiouridine synthesizing protein A
MRIIQRIRGASYSPCVAPVPVPASRLLRQGVWAMPEQDVGSSEPRVVDVRWLEPPEPFVRVVAALEELPPGGTLRVLIHREPYPLYQMLDEEGRTYAVRFDPAGFFDIRIS